MSHNIISQNENLTVSNADKISNPNVQQISFAELVHTVQTSPNGLAIHFAKLRGLSSIEERKAYKQANLPYFSMAEFRENYRDDEHFKQTQFLLYDLDHIGTDEAVRNTKSLLMQDPQIFFCMVSPSGDGLKFCYKLDKPIVDGWEYRRVFHYYSGQFIAKYGYKKEFDMRADPSRGCFLTYDPDMYVNYEAEPITVDIPADYTIPEKDKLLALGIENPGTDPLTDLLSRGFTSPNRTPAMASIIGYMIHKGISRNTAVCILKLWNKQNTPPKDESDIDYTVNSMYDRYEHAAARLPFDVVVKENCYYKRVEKDGEMKDVLLTTFTVKPEELLVLEDGDCLQATVETNLGYTYSPVRIENADWLSKIRLLEAIGHQDCVMNGSDNDTQALCAAVNAQVPIRKRGTRTIGLHDESIWVVEGANITASGVSTIQYITPYQKGGDAFYHNIRYMSIPDDEYKTFINDFYANILETNTLETIVPWLSWILTTPIKQIIMRIAEGYPITFVHGTQGSGKTSMAKLFMRMHGYKLYEPSSCDMHRFPMLALLCSTNGIPVVLDEFKESDIKPDLVDNLYRFMRKVYAGETEPKGQSDQTVDQWRIAAPMCVMGEWNVAIPAISERMIMVKYTDVVKHNKGMQAAFQKVWALPLEAFMPRYIEFLLNQDVHALYKLASRVVKKHFKGITIAPRVMNNMTVMMLGMKLFKSYGRYSGVRVPKIDVGKILDHELEVITGTRTGFVRSAVDQFIEACSVMAQNKIIAEGEDFMVSRIDLKDIGSTNILAIRFKKVYAKFKEYARRTEYEGDQIDERSYMDQFGQCPYVYDKSYVVKFEDKSAYRCITINLEDAKKAGLDLEGFGIL